MQNAIQEWKVCQRKLLEMTEAYKIQREGLSADFTGVKPNNIDYKTSLFELIL